MICYFSLSRVFANHKHTATKPNPNHFNPNLHPIEYNLFIKQEGEIKMATIIASTDKLTAKGIKQIFAVPAEEATLKDVLKRHIASELYEAELKLVAGLRIAGKPYDCLNGNHYLGLEATVQKLISMDPANRVYREIVDWIQRNRHILSIQSIQTGQYDQEYPQMARQLADFRKRIMGTASLTAMRPLSQDHNRSIPTTRLELFCLK